MTAPTFPIQTLTSQLLEQTGPYAGREISSIQLADNLREAQLLAAPQVSALRELEAEVLQSPEALSHQPICQIHLPEREPNG